MTANDDGPAPDSMVSANDCAPPISSSLDHADLQRIWLGTQRRAWRMLAVVPIDEWISSYQVASVITTLGIHHGESISVADLRDIRLNRVSAFLEAAGELMRHGRRVVFSTRSITENVAAIPLARAADGVILCVSMGSTSIRSIEDAIEQIGKERFLGSVLIHDAKTPAGRAASVLRHLQAPS